MSQAAPPHRHALAETAAEYGTDRSGGGHTKISISLPADLLLQVRAAAEETGIGVSGVIAAALRHSLQAVQQERLERALALDAGDNAEWATDALELTARSWSELEW